MTSTNFTDPTRPSWRHPVAAVRAGWEQLLRPGREVAATRTAYTATTHTAAAACAQLGAATDPLVRTLALLQLQAAHDAASLLAEQLPGAWLPHPGTEHPGPGSGGLTLGQVHARIAQLTGWLAHTEHTEHAPAGRVEHHSSPGPGPSPSPSPGPGPGPELAPLYAQLDTVRDPHHRALLVLQIALTTTTGDAGSVSGGRGRGERRPIAAQLIEVATAYLRLAGGDRHPDRTAAWLWRDLLRHHRTTTGTVGDDDSGTDDGVAGGPGGRSVDAGWVDRRYY